jgi:type I restriction enzyme M protein
MEPYIAEAERARAEVVSLKEKLKALKSANPKDKKIEVLETKIWEQEKAASEAKSAADAIDAAVFDVKAVNPNAIVKNDSRTPDEVIRSIEDQGKIVGKALETLRTLLQGRDSVTKYWGKLGVPPQIRMGKFG